MKSMFVLVCGKKSALNVLCLYLPCLRLKSLISTKSLFSTRILPLQSKVGHDQWYSMLTASALHDSINFQHAPLCASMLINTDHMHKELHCDLKGIKISSSTESFKIFCLDSNLSHIQTRCTNTSQEE